MENMVNTADMIDHDCILHPFSAGDSCWTLVQYHTLVVGVKQSCQGFKAGDYVCVHSDTRRQYNVLCHVATVAWRTFLALYSEMHATA